MPSSARAFVDDLLGVLPLLLLLLAASGENNRHDEAGEDDEDAKSGLRRWDPPGGPKFAAAEPARS